MSDRNRIQYTTQEINNLCLDNQNVDITSLRGGLVYANGLGWARAPLKNCFAVEQYDWAAGTVSGFNAIYEGFNGNYSAADGDTTWVIIKNTYDANDNVTKRQMRVTSWASRTSGW